MVWAAKDPDSKLDFVINWLTWLTVKDPITGLYSVDTISASEWVDLDTDLTEIDDSFTDSTTTIWLTGGVIGKTYYVTNRITTAAGRIQDRTVELECEAL